jgi:hypothetical protein
METHNISKSGPSRTGSVSGIRCHSLRVDPMPALIHAKDHENSKAVEHFFLQSITIEARYGESTARAILFSARRQFGPIMCLTPCSVTDVTSETLRKLRSGTSVRTCSNKGKWWNTSDRLLRTGRFLFRLSSRARRAFLRIRNPNVKRQACFPKCAKSTYRACNTGLTQLSHPPGRRIGERPTPVSGIRVIRSGSLRRVMMVPWHSTL